MKTILKISLLLLSFCNSSFLYSQNLVPNPSFEIYSSCPNNSGEVNNATGWNSYLNSPDYFNSCASVSSSVSIPENILGYQFPANGNAYCGFITYDVNGLDREILGIQLSAPLIISQKYYISLKINRADSNYFVGYATNKIGVKLFTTHPDTILINNSAQFYTNTVITDTAHWLTIFGSFIADSSYQYMMLGNFFDDSHTTVINDLIGQVAYYFADDICLSTDSAYSYTYLGINDHEIENTVKIFPNPANESFFIQGDPIKEGGIYNVFGQLIENIEMINTKELTIDCSSWASGMYFLQTGRNRYEIIINH